MAEFGITCFVYTLLLIIGEAIHLLYSPGRSRFWIRMPVCVVVLIGISFAIPEFSGDIYLLNALMHFIVFALSVAGAFICFRDTIFHIVNKCVFGWLTMCCSFAWSWLIQSLFNASDYTILIQVLCAVVNYGVFLGFSLFNHSQRKKRRKNRGFPFQLMLVEIIAVIIFSFVGTNSSYGDNFPLALLVFIVIYLCFGLLNAFSDEKRLEDERRILEQMHEKERMQYETSKEYMDMINMKSHDMKHLLYGLKEQREAAAGEGGTAVDDELKSINSMLKDYDADVRTGCEALDIVLTEKSRYCAKHSIQFTPIADGSVISFMDSVDIYSMLGNMLDNAIEAVEKADEERRMISLYIEKESGVAHIRVKNYSPETVSFSQGMPVSSKKDRLNHGFGTKSIRSTAEKYQGVATFRQSGDFFVTDAVIPLPDTDSASAG